MKKTTNGDFGQWTKPFGLVIYVCREELMKKIQTSVLAIAFASLFLAVAAPRADAADPYVVRGNEHIIIGITLDEAAVRAALPAGLEPTESISGGINVYTSGGGYATEPYTRAYVWADLEGHDSANGSKGRWILWGATSGGLEKMNLYYDNIIVAGQASVTENGNKTIGVASVGGSQILNVEIELSDEPCGEASGILNYPVMVDTSGKLGVETFTWVADICGATATKVDFNVASDHPLSKFKPTAVIWAAQAKNLSFGSKPPQSH